MRKETDLLKRCNRTQSQVMLSLSGFKVEEALTILSACMANILAYSVSTDGISKENACKVVDASLEGVKQVLNMSAMISTSTSFELNQ